MAHDCGKVELATPSIYLHCEVHSIRNSRKQYEYGHDLSTVPAILILVMP